MYFSKERRYKVKVKEEKVDKKKIGKETRRKVENKRSKYG